MVRNPKISIIFPVYNTQLFLNQAIDSVVDQSFCDLELIAINDASTDSSLDILQYYEKKDERIRIIDLPDNQGSGRVRNMAMELARGEYFIFLDSDDFLADNILALLGKKIQKKPDCEVFVWGFSTYYGNGKRGKLYLPKKPDKKKNETHFQLGLTNRKGFSPFAWTYVVKKTFVRKHSLCFAEGVYFEDIQFSTQLLFYATKVGFIEKVAYYYRKHGASITGRSSKQKIDDKFTAFIRIKTFLQEKGVFSQYQSLYLARFLALCVHTSFNEYFTLPKNERDKELDDYMFKIRKSKLLRKENLLLLRNIALSLPKSEKEVRRAYLGAYHGLNAIKKRYTVHRFLVQVFTKIHRKRKGLN